MKPAIVLVHGAWHQPIIFQELIDLLKQAGFETHTTTLPTNADGTRGKADFPDDVEAIRSLIAPLLEQSREVVILAHSYGGTVATEASRGFASSERTKNGLGGGIVHLVYMCAFMLQVGQSLASASQPRPKVELVKTDASTGLMTVPVEAGISLFFNGVEASKAQAAAELLLQMTASAFLAEITYPAWRDIPTTYLRCLEDNALILERQDAQIKAVRDAGSKVNVIDFQTGHSPFLSMPNEVVKAIDQVSDNSR